MKIGENGQLTFDQSANNLGLTNEEIVFLYLSTRAAYLDHKKMIQQRKREAKAIVEFMKAMGGNAKIKGITGQETSSESIIDKIKELSGEMSEHPQDAYIKMVCSKLFPFFLMIKESDEVLVNAIVEKCFDKETEIIKQVLEETDLNDEEDVEID